MKGDVNDAVANGAHAMFLPHGLGHMMGLDVHDMENLGENLVGYEQNTKRKQPVWTCIFKTGKKIKTRF